MSKPLRGQPTVRLVGLALILVVGSAPAAAPYAQQRSAPASGADTVDVFAPAADHPLPAWLPGWLITPTPHPPAADDPVLIWLVRDDADLSARFALPDLAPHPGGGYACVRLPADPLIPIPPEVRLLATRGGLCIASIQRSDPADWLAAVLDGSIVPSPDPAELADAAQWEIERWPRFRSMVEGLVAVGRSDEALLAVRIVWDANDDLYDRQMLRRDDLAGVRTACLVQMWELLLAADGPGIRDELIRLRTEETERALAVQWAPEGRKAFGRAVWLARILGNLDPLIPALQGLHVRSPATLRSALTSDLFVDLCEAGHFDLVRRAVIDLPGYIKSTLNREGYFPFDRAQALQPGADLVAPWSPDTGLFGQDVPWSHPFEPSTHAATMERFARAVLRASLAMSLPQQAARVTTALHTAWPWDEADALEAIIATELADSRLRPLMRTAVLEARPEPPLQLPSVVRTIGVLFGKLTEGLSGGGASTPESTDDESHAADH